MQLEGKVAELIYYNDKNTYTVFLFKTEEKSIMCVGYVPYIKVSDKLQLVGDYVEHKVYGKQFKIDTYEKAEPTGEEELLEYLSSGFIKGIGEKTAEKIIVAFGIESMDILKNHPEKLATIRGISKEKAYEIQECIEKEWSFLQLSKYLQKYGIGITNINNVYKQWGANSLNLINENPYILIDVLNGVEFSHIDKIASDMNFEKDNINRIKSGIKYCLMNLTYNGNTCGKYENLIIAVKNFLNVEETLIENAIIDLINEKEIVIENRDNDKYIYLQKVYILEEYISKKIINFSMIKESNNDINKKIALIEKEQQIILSNLQKEAIKMAYNNNISIITGGPGTGKTTIIKCLIELFQKDNLDVALCAPTGRAAKRMTDVTGVEAKTIHRLLEITKVDDERNKFDIEVAPLYKDVVIIDEVSMIDTILFGYVLKAIDIDTKLILVGDADQLPSVGPGDILNNMINSGIIKHIFLDEIFRQAKKSLIITNAHLINEGQYPILDQKDKDFFFIGNSDVQIVLNTIIDLCDKRLSTYGNYDKLKDIQVICPSKKGDVGTRNLNKCLQFKLNPKSNFKKEKMFGQTIFREGDKIMQTKNNYDITWEKEDGTVGVGIFNGDLGYINSIDIVLGEIEVLFDDGKKVIYTSSIIEELELAYAITVHKSQGSEFDVVIIPIVKGPPMLYTRNLLYTGVTRAKKLLVAVGIEDEIKKMVDNVNERKRITGLEYKLKNNIFTQ